jgi:hypothetical protein
MPPPWIALTSVLDGSWRPYPQERMENPAAHDARRRLGLPRLPWLQPLLTDAPAAFALGAAGTCTDPLHKGRHVFLIARVKPGCVYGGLLTRWDDTVRAHWQFHGQPRDAYTLEVAELFHVDPPVHVSPVGKGFSARPFTNSLRSQWGACTFRRVLQSGAAELNAEAMLQNVGCHLDQLPCLPLPAPIIYLMSKGYSSILCRASWQEAHGASKLWKDMASDMQWPPQDWLLQFRHAARRRAVCKPATPQILPELASRNLAHSLRQWAPGIIAAAHADGDAEDVTAQLELAIRQLEAHTSTFAPDSHASGPNTHFKHSSLKLVHSVAASLHLRNRSELQAVFRAVLKASPATQHTLTITRGPCLRHACW